MQQDCPRVKLGQYGPLRQRPSNAQVTPTAIEAAATDSSGNVYVAETSILRTTKLGQTWTHVGNPPPEMNAIPWPSPLLGGFVSAVFQIQVPVPANILNFGGTDVGNGVQRVQVGLLLDVNLESLNIPVSNSVGVYVQ
jgi:hypothetical protein